MSDKEERKKVISNLELIKQSLTDAELKESLTYAIESIKVDMVYELMHEKIEFIEIPEGATNGDMIKTVFGIADNDIDEGLSTTYIYTKTRVLNGYSQDYERIFFNRDWWNAPYKKED